MQFWKCKTFEKHIDNECISWKLSHICCLFDHRHLWAHLLFSSLLGGDLDFGMEVHVNSFQQITKEDQHRRESRKIFTPQTGRFGATKHTNNSSKQTKKQNMTNTTTQLFQHLFLYMEHPTSSPCTAQPQPELASDILRRAKKLNVESSRTDNHGPRFLPNQQHSGGATICWIPNGSHKTRSNIPIQLALGTALATVHAEEAFSRVYIPHKSLTLPNWCP